MSGAKKAAIAAANKAAAASGAPRPTQQKGKGVSAILRMLGVPFKLDSDWRPSSMTLFGVAMILYFFVMSGVIYDYLKEVPSLGHSRDPVTGKFRSEVFMTGRVNGQYIIEGLAAGFLIMLGGAGFIMLDMSHTVRESTRENTKSLLTLSGLMSILVSVSLLQAFCRIKIPQYLATSH